MLLCLKRANITPQRGVSELDREYIQICHSISNLPIISKFIEKVVARRIEKHLEHQKLNDHYQSVYRSIYSIETALFCLSGLTLFNTLEMAKQVNYIIYKSFYYQDRNI